MTNRGRPRLFDDATLRRIRRRVLVEGIAPKVIAAALGCTPWTIRSIVHKYGVYREKPV